jgi:hypothetical protein
MQCSQILVIRWEIGQENCQVESLNRQDRQIRQEELTPRSFSDYFLGALCALGGSNLIFYSSWEIPFLRRIGEVP